MIKNVLYSLLIVLLVAACSSDVPTAVEVQLGEQLLDETFDDEGDWDIQDDDGMTLYVEDGVYNATLAWRDRYFWGTNDEVHNDAVIEADIQFGENNRLTIGGIICRASPQNTGEGYYFLITAIGKYGILSGISSGSSDIVVAMETHEAILTDGEVNHVRVDCVGNLLQFFVNDTLLASVRNEKHRRGFTGLVISMPPNASGTGHVMFDNVRVWEASIP